MTLTSGAEPSPEMFERWDSLGLVRKPGIRGWFRRHPWWMSAVVVGIYLLWSLWVFPAAAIDMSHGWGWLLFGHLVIAAALFFRHIRPIAVLVLVVVFETAMLFYYPWQGAQMVGLSFAAYAVGYRYGLRWGLLMAVPGTALAYSTLLTAPRWIEDHGPSIWMRLYAFPEEVSEYWVLMMMAIMMTAAVVFATGLGTAVRRGHNHEREILEWAQKSHELAQLGERNRIAREMHDVVAHSLSVMISLADGARVVAKKDPERATEVIGEVSSTGRSALADMRRLLGVLRKGEDVEDARRPITESLDELYENFRQAGLPLRVEHTGPPLPENAAFGLTVHRIIQESLTNVLRYAQNIRRVEVSIEHQPGTSEAELENLKAQGFSEKEQAALGLSGAAQVIITITDDGVATGSGTRRESVGSGLGIQGMQERASFYNGSVYAGPGKHHGWMVRAVLEPPQEKALTGKGTE
ncbi:sensor histidine kinase [Nesterenkonia sp. MY13]|uniref:histidine kinase n=1 Tax=Nesterenkonia sedimenti TaxID=1463632 RepID=A0A7X8TLY9_9MICC|nr:histidine kinase [Nesterenkonia sedimenti]NLS10453.1 sensor histidine kinase [Nesterenkonia sedimenti]